MTLKQKLIDLILRSPFAIIIDISRWQIWFDLDRALAEKILELIDGVMIRAGNGRTVDVKFLEFCQELAEHPHVLRGVYWYFVSWLPWETQCALYIATIKLFDFDWICLDVEEYLLDDMKAAQYSITGIRFMKRLQEAFPNKRITVYSRKDVYQRLRQFSAEWDNWDYHHAQYWWSTWKNITQYFIDWWAKVFLTNERNPDLPASRVNLDRPYIKQQIGEKTNLGADFGVGSENVDVNITKDTYEDFVEYLGEPARWSGEVPEDEEEPPTDEEYEMDDETKKTVEQMLAVGGVIGMQNVRANFSFGNAPKDEVIDGPVVPVYLEARAVAKPTKDHVVLWKITSWNDAHLKTPPRERGAILAHPVDMLDRAFILDGVLVHLNPKSIKVDSGTQAHEVISYGDSDIAVDAGLYMKLEELEF